MAKSNKLIFFYYLSLLVILVSWTNVNSTPNLLLKLSFMAATVLPCFIWHSKITILATVTFYTISKFGMAPSYMPTEVAFYLLFGLLFILSFRSRYTHKKWLRIPVLLALLIFFVDFLLSTRIEDSIICLLFIILCAYCFDSREDLYIDNFHFVFLIPSIVLSLQLLIFGSNFSESYGNTELERTGWVDANYFGCVIGMGSITSLSLLLTKDKLHNKLTFFICILCLLVSFIALLINSSRGSILAVFLAFVYLVLFSRVRILYRLFILATIFLFILYLYDKGYFELLEYRILNDSGGGSGRIDIWNRKIDSFLNESGILNYLFGWSYYQGYLLGNYGISGRGFHNDFLAYLVDYGIFGFILFVLFLLVPVIVCKAKNKHVICGFVYLVVCNLSLEPFSLGLLIFYFFWFYLLIEAKFNTKN